MFPGCPALLSFLPPGQEYGDQDGGAGFRSLRLPATLAPGTSPLVVECWQRLGLHTQEVISSDSCADYFAVNTHLLHTLHWDHQLGCNIFYFDI